MAAYQAGRLDRFEQLYGALAPPLRRYLIMLTRDAAIADDLLQEAFLQVHRSRHTCDIDQPLRPWVFAIARHVFLMYARATRRRLVRVGPRPDNRDMPVPPEVEGLADRAGADAFPQRARHGSRSRARERRGGDVRHVGREPDSHHDGERRLRIVFCFVHTLLAAVLVIGLIGS